MIINCPFEVNEVVFDDMTRSKAKVIGLKYDEGKTTYDNVISMGCWGIYLDKKDHLGFNGRHPWEIGKWENFMENWFDENGNMKEELIK